MDFSNLDLSSFGLAGLVTCIIVDAYLILSLMQEIRQEKSMEFIEYSQESLDNEYKKACQKRRISSKDDFSQSEK